MTSVLKCQCETGWNKLRVWCRHCESHAALRRDCDWMLQMQFRRWEDRGLWELLRSLQKSNNHLSTRKVREDAIWTSLPTSWRQLTEREGPCLQTRFQELVQKKNQNKTGHLLATWEAGLTLSLMSLLWLKLKRKLAQDAFCHNVLLKRGWCAWSRGDPEVFHYLTVLLHSKNAFGLSQNTELEVRRALIKMG